MDKAAAREHLRATLARVVEALEEYTKRRDRREPGREEKEQAEAEIEAWMTRYFRRQSRRVRERLEATYPERKALGDVPPPDSFYDDLFEDDEEEQGLIAELIALLQNAVRGGITLFGQQSALQIDWTLTNTRAAEWARGYAFDLVRGIDETTREALQAQISAFVETPGMTLGDLYASLPFGEVRAQQVAITEVTRAYSKGNQQAGEDLRKEYPDVRVIETWFTNADERVCGLCLPLDGQEIEQGQKFYEPGSAYEDGYPPRHVGCRCWTESTTALANLD